MSHPHLPAELLDHTVDHLHDARDALKSCCLVSRSWVPRTRRHLFADVRFRTEKDLQSWKNTFPDPSTSPAHYTKYLLVHCPEAVTAADAEERGWIPAFSRTARFHVNISDEALSLVPFHGFSPAVKSLSVFYVDYPFSRILSLIRSFPHIEDLSLDSFDDDPIKSDDSSDGQQTTVQPPFTGTLGLHFQGDMSLVVSRLLPLPSGYRFRKLDLLLGCEEDVLFASVLVERCRLTLESIRVNVGPYGMPPPHSIDLSTAPGLKDVVFRSCSDTQWVSMTLRTVTCDHVNLQQISLEFWDIRQTPYQEWAELDTVIVQLWESHSVRPRVTFDLLGSVDTRETGREVESLLSEATGRGIVDLFERSVHQ